MYKIIQNIIYIYIYNIKLNGLGWSGPTDWAGLSPKLLGRIRPKMDWADLGPKQILFWARPGPEDRAGPAQPTGPDSVQNCWADFGPKWIGPISAQNKYSSGPDPAQKTGLGQDPPGPVTKTGGGNYFPPTPACRTLIVLHAEKKRKK